MGCSVVIFDVWREHKVEVVGVETLEKLIRVVGLLGVQHDLRGEPAQSRGDRRDEDTGHAGDAAQPDRCCDRVLVGSEIDARLVHPRSDRRGMREQAVPCGRQLDPSSPRGADDDVDPHDLLQRSYLLAHRRLRVSEALGGPADRPFFGNCHEGVDVPHLENRPGPIRSFADSWR